MARYIDATKLMDELNDAQIEFDENYKGLGKAKVMLSLHPTADVVEVKHGEWSLKYIGAGHCWECSECAFQLCTMPRTNYCPNCGAKMDGEKR